MSRARMRPPAHLLSVLLVAALVAGCGPPRHRLGMLRSRVVFVAADLRTPRAPAPATAYRLWMPFILGEVYGEPGTGDLMQARLASDGAFTMDLDASLDPLRRSLEPTQLSESYLHLEPAQARIARLAPQVLQSRGIEPLGATDWVDAASRRVLLLVYCDRNARLHGERLGTRGPHLRYEVALRADAYTWVEQRTDADGTLEFRAVAAPARVLLAVSPAAP